MKIKLNTHIISGAPHPHRAEEIKEIVRKLQELQYESDLGTLSPSREKWTRTLKLEFQNKGRLSPDQKKTLDDIYEQVFG